MRGFVIVALSCSQDIKTSAYNLLLAFVLLAFNFIFPSPRSFPGNNSDLITLVSSSYEENEPVVFVM